MKDQLLKQAQIARRLAETLEAAAESNEGVVFENATPKVEAVKRGRGRPKGSKNKPKTVESEAKAKTEKVETQAILSTKSNYLKLSA